MRNLIHSEFRCLMLKEQMQLENVEPFGERNFELDLNE